MIPDSLELPRVLESRLRLHDAREEGDEEWRAEVGGIYRFVLEVVVEVG